MKKWRKRDPGVNTVRDAHLRRLGITTTDVINSWYKRGMEDSYRMYGIDRLCDLIRKYKDRQVVIMGDYDVDGITATSILFNTLRWLGFADVRYRIPRRFTEGFGLNRKMIDEVVSKDALIITVDNGIGATNVVAYAKGKGHSIVVTDHHEPVRNNGTIVIPDADIIIDPKIMPGLADFDGYCGAGIAFKIARKLLEGNEAGVSLLLPLAAFGTVCDQVIMREENYYIVRKGLTVLNAGRAHLPGVEALRQAMGISFWTSRNIAFQAGPALNAAERMRDGMAAEAVRLLTSRSDDECRRIAESLAEYNRQRKEVVAKGIDLAQTWLERDASGSILCPIIEYVPGCSEGVIGIIAGKLCEKYGIPTGIFTDAFGGFLKGSFRAPEGYNIKQLLDRCSSKFVEYGGHTAAAGASVRKTRFEEMKKALREKAGPVPRPKGTALYDLEISNEEMSEIVMEEEQYGPFGNGNEGLVFKVNDFSPINFFGDWVQIVGNSGIKIRSGYSDAIGFDLESPVRIDGPDPLTIYGTIGMNRFNGHVTPQIEILDICR